MSKPTASSSTTAAPPSVAIPSDEKWDHSIENTLRKTSMGFVAGLLPAVLFTRAPAARLGMMLFTTGIGMGIGYGEARYLFDHNIMFDQRHVISVQAFVPKVQEVAPTAKQ